MIVSITRNGGHVSYALLESFECISCISWAKNIVKSYALTRTSLAIIKTITALQNSLLYSISLEIFDAKT